MSPDASRFGKYEVHHEIGAGGFATVFRAYDTVLGRAVALKVLHQALLSDREFVQRFTTEARTVASLRHPAIVELYDLGQDNGRLFIAMALAERGNLKSLLDHSGALSYASALALLRPVAEALDYAHARGVVHRDLKPANILLDDTGWPLVSDFGLVRVINASTVATSIGRGFAGTPSYIAPEVWDGQPAGPPADRYALACIAFELLTGNVLFEAKTPLQATRAHDRGPQFPSAWPPTVPPGIEAVLGRALAPDPQARYPSASAFLDALAALPASSQAAVSRLPAATKPPRPGWRSRLPLIIGGALIVLLCLGLLSANLFGAAGSWQGGTTAVTAARTGGPAMELTTAEPSPGTATAQPAPATPGEEADTAPQQDELFPRVGALIAIPEGKIAFEVALTDNSARTIFGFEDGAKTARQLTPGEHTAEMPALSRDGQWLAYSSNRNGASDRDIFVVRLGDPSTLRAVTGAPDKEFAPSWSHDGTKLAFMQSNSPNSFRICVVDIAPPGESSCTDWEQGLKNPSWSPDGQIVFVRETRDNILGINVMNADLTGSVLVRSVSDFGSGATDIRYTAWSPDGAWIAFSVRRADGRFELWRVGVEGNLEAEYLTEGEWPAWSPSSRFIAYTSAHEGAPRVYIYDTASRQSSRLTDTAIFAVNPTWSP